MDWNDFRNAFPVTRRWAYFDHAAVAPLSGPAQQALAEWAIDLAENGDVYEHNWLRRIEAVRQNFGRLLNADPLDIAFVKNTSEGIGIVAEGFPWADGDNIVTAAEEYPANVYPWLNLRSRGVETRLVPSRGNKVAVDDIRAAVDRRTRIVSLSLVEFASGYRNDLDAIGSFCRERDILFFVDAIQGLGVLPLDVAASPIDALAADGHKWLVGPEGAGVFYIRRELVEELHAVGVGWNSVRDSFNFSRLDFQLKPHAGRWESGSLNVGGVMALGASLELLQKAGVSALAERILFLTEHLCEQARRAGFEVFSSREPAERSGIVSLVVPGDPRERVRRCRAENVAISQRGGRIRVSPHAYNTTDELDRLVQLLGANP